MHGPDGGVPSSLGPRGIFADRLAARRERIERERRRDRALATTRLAVFGLGIALSAGVMFTDLLGAVWLLPVIAAFVALVVVHDAVRRALRAQERAAAFYERELARLDLDFAGTGDDGARFDSAEHPYAAHLDLFGPGALYERIANAQTPAGTATLARWLLAPAGVPELRARQAAVAELQPRLDLREDLWGVDTDALARLSPDSLTDWGSAPPVELPGWLRRAAAALAALNVAAAVGALGFETGPGPLVLSVALSAACAFPFRARTGAIVEAAQGPARNLGRLGKICARFEREPFEASRLRELARALETDGHPPSHEIARLRRMLELLEWRGNQFFALIAPLLMWTTQVACAIEAWRVRCGPHLAGWLDAVGELEALSDLGGYAFSRPDDPFPELCLEAPRFEAEGLGHPLLPDDRRVRNDLSLGGELRLLVVSGSNMSGKSTLLRSVGTNALLGLAGAPVCARRLRMSPLRVGASLRVSDSLREGSSRFYTEIRRLRSIADLANRSEIGDGEVPLLFLLDEILHGTHSHDRRVASEQVLRKLIDQGSIGLITTHDLALADIADVLGGRAANVHFEDQVTDGRMDFDYKLRPGVVQHSNALELMRSVGLEV